MWVCAVDETVADLEIVAWNEVAAFYHATLAALPLGTPIAISGYRMKVYNSRFEASLNVEHPRARIYRITDGTCMVGAKMTQCTFDAEVTQCAFDAEVTLLMPK